MLPRLTAEESIQESTRVLMGTAKGTKEHRQAIGRKWDTAAGGVNTAKATRVKPTPKPLAELERDLAALGIAVVRVKKDRRADRS